MKLYEISQQLEAVLHEAVDRETGELDEAALEAIESLELQREEKVLAVAAYLKGEDAEGDAVMAEAKKLEARANKHFKRAEKLREYIGRNIRDGEKFSDGRSLVKLRPSEAVIVEDASKLPDEFMVQPPTPAKRPDKKALKAALKDGAVAGALIEKRRKVVVE